MSAGDNGVRVARQSVLTLTLDHESMLVAIGGTAMPIALAQMICDEAMRLLDEQRRVAAMRVLQQQQAEAVRTAQILGRVRGTG
jgi:lipopolysaccharide biosynthesis regulator YciM